MDALERLANWMTDMDWGWWPFLHLRPPKDERLSTLRVVKMALHYGPAVGLIALAIIYVRARSMVSATFAGAVLLSSLVVFFVGFRVTFAYFWNRRAERLRATPSEAEPPAWTAGVD